MRRLFPLMLCALLLAAQQIRFSVRAGLPVTPYFETGASGSLHHDAHYSAATRRYTAGVAVEGRVGSIGLELDALYHRMGYVAYVSTFNSATGAYSDSAVDVKGNSWDFPLIAKRRFGRGRRVYAGAGGVMRYVGPVRGRGEKIIGSLVDRSSSTVAIDTTEPSELRKRFYPGLTAAAGVELGAGWIRVIPEWRYTRWTANITGPGGLLRFAPNQLEFLLGLSF